MGCDAYANKDGVFEIEVRDYGNKDENGKKIPTFPTRIIRIENLKPFHRIDFEILEGDER